MEWRILFYQYKAEKEFLARFDRRLKNFVYSEKPFSYQKMEILLFQIILPEKMTCGKAGSQNSI